MHSAFRVFASFVSIVYLFPLTAWAQPLKYGDYPKEVRDTLEEVRKNCLEQGKEVALEQDAGVTIVDLNRDGSQDILLDAWRACEVKFKANGVCTTYGCNVKVFKHTAPNKWIKVLDEPVGDLFLSVSSKRYFILAAVSITGKHSKLCGGSPTSDYCDYLLYWKSGRWVWNKIR